MKIAIVGPPGSGKTTFCYGLYYFLRCMGKRVEFVPELIKYRVYKGEDFNKEGFDIWNNLEQRNFEEQFNNAPLDFIICEAPLCNGYFYTSFYEKVDEAAILKKIAKKTINNYDVVLKLHFKTDKENYETFGRKESYEQSVKLNDHIFEEFSKLGFKNTVLDINDRNDIHKVLSELILIYDSKFKEKV